uniref:AlNc14C156G7638 protein n=1 Tax=Albugo laibachii Nc14 TaxID=890382 RepID=F0WME1_9STRA|nr:AlNc14C156G7638 [Albugo laibachii Nc14]|eukprot:CCA22473.1 AlNc14C156G7638 [Albugo laibachii Nc14]
MFEFTGSNELPGRLPGKGLTHIRIHLLLELLLSANPSRDAMPSSSFYQLNLYRSCYRIKASSPLYLHSIVIFLYFSVIIEKRKSLVSYVIEFDPVEIR